MIPHSQLQIAYAILAGWHSNSFDGPKKDAASAVCFNAEAGPGASKGVGVNLKHLQYLINK